MGEGLTGIITAGNVVSNADPASVENLKYDFRTGHRILKAEIGSPQTLRKFRRINDLYSLAKSYLF